MTIEISPHPRVGPFVVRDNAGRISLQMPVVLDGETKVAMAEISPRMALRLASDLLAGAHSATSWLAPESLREDDATPG